MPVDHVGELTRVMDTLLNNLDSFQKVEVARTDLKKYTAEAMTGIFINNIKKYV